MDRSGDSSSLRGVTVPDYADPRPPYRQIADDLRGQIKNGRLKPGERVPSNKALSERYSVATATIRSALDELRNEKLIQTQGHPRHVRTTGASRAGTESGRATQAADVTVRGCGAAPGKT